MLNAVRRGTRYIRNEVHAEYTKRGIGRALKEGRGSRILGGSSLATIIKQGRTKYSKGDETIETSVYGKGTAALVQQGGRTVKHDISPSRQTFLQARSSNSRAMWRRIEYEKLTGTGSFGLKGALSNQARGGGFFASGTVKHPGSQFKKDDFLGRGSKRGAPRFKEECAKGMLKVAAVVNGG